MDLSILVIVVALVALVSPVWVYFMHKRAEKKLDTLVAVATYIYSVNDPDVLEELALLTDVRRLLLHLELTEGRVRIG